MQDRLRLRDEHVQPFGVVGVRELVAIEQVPEGDPVVSDVRME